MFFGFNGIIFYRWVFMMVLMVYVTFVSLLVFLFLVFHVSWIFWLLSWIEWSAFVRAVLIYILRPCNLTLEGHFMTYVFIFLFWIFISLKAMMSFCTVIVVVGSLRGMFLAMLLGGLYGDMLFRLETCLWDSVYRSETLLLNLSVNPAFWLA